MPSVGATRIVRRPEPLHSPSKRRGGMPTMMGAFVGKGPPLKTGQTHVQRYLEPLMRKIKNGQIEP